MRVNVILDEIRSGMCYSHAMVHQTESELLAKRLDAILSERAAIKKRDDELSADEQRIRLALDVIKSVMADYGQAPEVRPAIQLSGHATVSMTASGTLSTTPTALAPAQPKQRLEDLILQAFDAKDGMTSLEVVGMLELVSEAKRESVMSTLSRMASKGLMRREGKLYFRRKQGEGPEVGTTGPSVATESVAGQHTSSAPIDEEGDLA